MEAMTSSRKAVVTLPTDKGVQDLPPPGLGHRVERIRCRRRSRHRRIICPYGYISSPRPQPDGERAHQLAEVIVRVQGHAKAPVHTGSSAGTLCLAPYHEAWG